MSYNSRCHVYINVNQIILRHVGRWTNSMSGAVFSLCSSKMSPTTPTSVCFLDLRGRVTFKGSLKRTGIPVPCPPHPRIHLRPNCSKAKPCHWPQYSNHSQVICDQKLICILSFMEDKTRAVR